MKNSILKNILPFLLLSLLSVALKAQTNVSGFISANTTWTLAGSPYIVVSNALVSQGVTLTINPGVVVKLDSACALQVDGEMIAIGTDTSRITFTSNKAIPQAGDWAELHFSGYAVNAVFDNSGNYLSGCIMKYCDVLYGGNLQFGAIHIESSSPYFSRCNISYSASDGVYCNGSSFLIDSSVVDTCSNFGLEFSNVNFNSCGLTVQSDTIENCFGGIMVDENPGCITIIANCYFISNKSFGALSCPVSQGKIIGNYFINNSTNSNLANSIVDISGDTMLISDNSFINNNTGGNNSFSILLVRLYPTGNAMVSDNFFFNNSIIKPLDEGDGLVEGIVAMESGTDTVQCNLFLDNDILYNSGIGSGCVSAAYSGTVVINNNIFDGNVNNDNTYIGASVAWVSSRSPAIFNNNTIRNNSASLSTCCLFFPNLESDDPSFYIEQNNFINNEANAVIYLSGPNTANVNYNFLYMKNNNFNDPAVQYELYNDIPYGSPDLYPDSNYWGSTSTQHIDSVIYDYFDNENQSVVYYEPILAAPVAIDTTCAGGFLTGIKNVDVDEAINSKAFPNPFSTSTEVMFGKELIDAEVWIYNVFGQQVSVMQHINGDRVIITRGNLCSGVYIYAILDKQGRIGNGKLVLE